MSGSSGYPTTKKSLGKIAGYPEDSTQVSSQFNTLQDTGSDRIALDVTQRVAFKVEDRVVNYATKRLVASTVAHNARKGDLIKFTSGALIGIDAPVLNCPDVNTLILGTELNVAPSAADTFEICRYTFWKTDSDGNLSVVSDQGPSKFVKDTVETVVAEDTVTPANNKPNPSGMMIKKDDGSWHPVTLDTTNPYQHTPIPVCITDLTGTASVTINAGDISVGIKHNGADPSSVRIGDGTTLAGITLSNELKTHDTELLAELKLSNAQLIDGDILSANVDDTAGASLVVPTAGKKKIRFVQNSGVELYIFKGATKIGALEKGGKIDFFATFNGVDALIIKSKAGTNAVNLTWNILE